MIKLETEFKEATVRLVNAMMKFIEKCKAIPPYRIYCHPARLEEIKRCVKESGKDIDVVGADVVQKNRVLLIGNEQEVFVPYKDIPIPAGIHPSVNLLENWYERSENETDN